MDSSFTNLNQKLNDWKSQLSHTGLSSEDQEELKVHMDDVIQELSHSDLKDDEIWLLAVNRIGSLSSIEQEFKKVNPDIGFRRDCILLINGAVIFMILQGLFILLPAYLYKSYNFINTLNYNHSTSFGSNIFSFSTILLLLSLITIVIKGKTLLLNFAKTTTKNVTGWSLVVIGAIILTGFLNIQNLNVIGTDSSHSVGPAFKTLSITFYLGLMGIMLYFSLLGKQIDLRTFHSFNRQIDWKIALIAGILAGIAVTFSYTYKINFLPGLVGCPLFALIGWMISHSAKGLLNLFAAQLYILVLWMIGISGEFASIFSFYYVVVLSSLIIGYFVGKSRFVSFPL